MQTILKFRGFPLAAAVGLIGLMATSVLAAGPTPKSPACNLYEGKVVLESLKQRATLLQGELSQAPSQQGDHCEMANIHYHLSRLLPDQKARYLKSCIDHSQKAITRNPSAGGAFFLKGLCLGRLGEINGVWGSIKIVKQFRITMETAADLDPAIDRGGPHRALGRYFYKLPGVLGGDIQKSIDHLRKAVKYGPQYWENHFFLAESYFENAQYQLARSELQRAIITERSLNNDPDHLARTVEFKGLMTAIKNHIH